MFVERPEQSNRGQPARRVWLCADWDDEDPSQQGVLPELDNDERYTINAEKALEPYLGKWVPVPYLRTRPGPMHGGHEPFDKGPTNWVRVRAIGDVGEHDGMKHTHRLTFAVDTELKPGGEDPSDGPYTGPTEKDAESQRTFRVVSGMSRLSWFIQSERGETEASPPHPPQEDPQLWVEEWLKALFVDFKRSSDPVRFRREQMQFRHEHSARWLAFIDLIAEHVRPPRLQFIDTVSKRVNEIDVSSRTVNVDLVLDVGNSRTCGILMERFPNQQNVELNNCYALRLRDLSCPEHVYTEPFDSHVELAAAAFGSEQISRVSGRARAFFWPSIVRIGREAARLRSEEAGKRTTGGMSSPKRYLWDMEAVQQEWRFPAASYVEGHGPPAERRVRRFVNEKGDVLSKVSGDTKLFRSLYGGRSVPDLESPGSQLKFSRSSFYTFMLAEVIWQAWVTINDPEIRMERGDPEVPRRLRKIILTLPTATPVREQRIMRARAESAVALLWDMMGWADAAPMGVTMPEVEVRWDEATCVQLVWLYGEIARKFAGNVAAFLDLAGQKRPPSSGGEPIPSLRVASLDIGGGTTDLMIITYTAIGDQGLRPEQNFREGVRIAGDDVLKLVVERIVLPAVQQHLQSCGLSFSAARDLLKSSFDDDIPDLTAEDRHRRRELVTEVLVPTALALVHAYESAGPGLYERVEVHKLGELVSLEGHGHGMRSAASYLEERASDRRAANFSLAETEISVDYQMMRAAVNDALGEVFDILAEALDLFDVDVVILSGRPARMPAIAELLSDRFPVPPNRIVPLHRYRAGTWYPFRATENGRIADPKTAVVVGALLCAYAQGQLHDFYYDAELIQMKSTARYIGVLGNDGKLSDQNVLFEAPVDGGAPALDALKTFDHYGIRQIGSRQLPHERWVTAPLYQLSVRTGDRSDAPMRQPIHVTVSRTIEEIDPEDKLAKKLEAEASKEQIKIVEAEDSSPNPRNVTQRMVLSFRTIGSDAYWLDNGVLNFP